VVFGSHPLEPARRLPPPPVHSSNPPQASPAGYSARGVWAPPRSLAATKGILSVPRGTEMFQFPRCPLTDSSVSARPCAGRVAPFGDPRIAGCQRLPGAFRRVAASFLGRQRQGIHHAPFLRRPAAVSLLAAIAVAVPRQGRTGARQQGRCRPPSTHARLRTQPRTHARSRPNPARRLPFLGAADRTAAATWAATSERAASHRGVVCVFLFTCSARGRPDTSTRPAPIPVRHESRVARCL
jgi:hypothetical protein